MESRTQDCLLGFHYMGRSRAVEHNNTHPMKSQFTSRMVSQVWFQQRQDFVSQLNILNVFVTECPSLPSSIAHGFVNGSGYLEGSQHHFTCGRGYSLIGVDTLVCSDTGAWSSPLPKCLIGIKNFRSSQLDLADLAKFDHRNGEVLGTIFQNLKYKTNQEVLKKHLYTC